MRILQLIDSLQTGGAERVAVNYANELATKIEYSGIVVTRSEGNLKQFVHSNVDYLFLSRTKIFDFQAILKLRQHIKSQKIDFLHAHNTSFFFAFLIKLIYPKIKVIWHDHYGNSEFLEKRKTFIYKITLPFFYGVITVNENLRKWVVNKIGIKNSIYLPNFPVLDDNIETKTTLKGKDGKRIVCLANLRPQKNHFLLLEVANQLKLDYPDWTFHLIGVNFEDAYSNKVLNQIQKLNLENNVFFYGSCSDITNILGQSSIGILTSLSEGLPMAILEYGLCSLPVLCTSVGELPTIINSNDNGILVKSNDVSLFYSNLVALIENDNLKKQIGNNLYQTILQNFSSNFVMNKYLNWLVSE